MHAKNTSDFRKAVLRNNLIVNRQIRSVFLRSQNYFEPHSLMNKGSEAVQILMQSSLVFNYPNGKTNYQLLITRIFFTIIIIIIVIFCYNDNYNYKYNQLYLNRKVTKTLQLYIFINHKSEIRETWFRVNGN